MTTLFPFRSRLAMSAVLAAFLVLLGAGEVATWRSTVARYELEVVGTARRLLQHARETFESARLPLVAIAEDLEAYRITKEGLAALDRRITRQVNASGRLSKLFVLGADGRVLAGLGGDQRKRDFSEQNFFGAHRSSVSQQFKIGQPLLNPFGQGWVIPVTQRVNTPDGHFGGVAVALFESAYFAKIYENAKMRPDDVLMLTHSDGRILATLPSHQARISSISKLQGILSSQSQPPFFSHHYLSTATDAPRIGGVAESPRSDLVMIVGMSQADALHDWISNVWPRWLLAAVLVVVTSLLSNRLNFQEKMRRKSERLRARGEDEFKQLAEASSDLILRLGDQGSCDYASAASEAILGCPPEELIGQKLVEVTHPNDAAAVEKALAQLHSGHHRKRLEFRALRKDGGVVWLEATVSRLGSTKGEENDGIVAIVRDVTKSKERYEELLATANTDALTGLANRGVFDERIPEMVTDSLNKVRPLSLLMIDADNFKVYNDTYGHTAGDECLRSIADVLQGNTRRRTDLAARYGGEEFAVILSDTDLGGALAIAEDIRDKIAALNIEHHANLPWGIATVSIGIASLDLFCEHDTSGLNLVNRADAALYEAKAAGRNTYTASADRHASPQPRTAA
ncbi:hypothetical protein DEM27_27815 [Metarhizobium album]|uniref:diguanylate cyclase n=1 Tax=Metarhizobium album TaxID=2182425 RepID=A0A2U2DHV6_9HYPH|nr:diguanylate cyclase [Rhizobium album]PWE52905.1 hypothetical protein DEM27_27815 [Rhizobium album]